jgi:ribosomal protein S27AE
MELSDFRLGDTLRLRNGETFVAIGKVASYSDRNGTYEGPFVRVKGSFDFLSLSDVVDVVERNERLCRFCGEGVTATDADTDYCSNCFYTGRPLDELHSRMFETLRTHRKVKSAEVWHTGGGCFTLAVRLHDGRLLSLTDGDAGIPELGEPWQSLAIADDEEAWDEWEEEKIEVRDGKWTDDEVILEVSRIANR